MITVAIPIFNKDILALVDELWEQLIYCDVPFEIICFDDGSKESCRVINSQLKNKPKVKYVESGMNIGRSISRNVICQRAIYETILFLDCDSKIIDEDFIQNYLNLIPSNQVISGGRKYSEKSPDSDSLQLHWLYGTRVESKNALERNKRPYHHFHSNNFLVSRQTLLDIPFDERLTQYGHEDSLWAQELKKYNISILHIENPVEHDGLEENSIFLRKATNAIENLVNIRLRGNQIGTKTEMIFNVLYFLKVHFIVFLIYQKMERTIVQKLKNKYPKLIFFSLYKLGVYLRYYFKLATNKKLPI